jgi:DNA-binding XRE family transcriptional regulator
MATHAVAKYNKPNTRQPRFPEIKLHISTAKQPTTSGERLYALRAQKGLTVERLAMQAGVDEMTIYHWESGRTQPKLLELGRVAKVLEADAV